MKGQGVVEYSLLLLLATAALLVMMAVIGPAWTQVMSAVEDVPDIPDLLGELPLTDHAQSRHWNEPYNAGNLPGMYDNDQCIRKSISYCPKEQKIKAMCEVKPGEWGGIVISMSTPNQPVIVTAFQGPEAYWMGNVRGCIPVVVP